ncbi:MAG: sugar-binding domain-containing protein [Anaerolineae bacterium]
MDGSSTSLDKLELLAKVAGLYFEEGRSQSDIALQTGYSRSMISRFLAEARELGVVEIRVNYPLARRTDLEGELEGALGLKVVRILRSGTLSYTQMLRRVGSLAARLVEEIIYDGMTIGLSWGTGLWETVTAIRAGAAANCRVVQMIGALGTADTEIDGPELARRLARLLIGHYSTLPAPLIVDDEQTRQGLMAGRRLQRLFDVFKEIDLALVGVGTVAPERASLLRAGYLDTEQLEALQAGGAVGDVCAIHFTRAGELLDTPLTRCVVGIDAATMRRIPLRLGIAGGQFKSRPIIGASRAGLINMLVTDEVAAIGIMQELKKDAERV